MASAEAYRSYPSVEAAFIPSKMSPQCQNVAIQRYRRQRYLFNRVLETVNGLGQSVRWIIFCCIIYIYGIVLNVICFVKMVFPFTKQIIYRQTLFKFWKKIEQKLPRTEHIYNAEKSKMIKIYKFRK